MERGANTATLEALGRVQFLLREHPELPAVGFTFYSHIPRQVHVQVPRGVGLESERRAVVDQLISICGVKHADPDNWLPSCYGAESPGWNIWTPRGERGAA